MRSARTRPVFWDQRPPATPTFAPMPTATARSEWPMLSTSKGTRGSSSLPTWTARPYRS
ncbi:hypothetical protein ACFPRL_00770 [Pseudoclavibacter helvolus]